MIALLRWFDAPHFDRLLHATRSPLHDGFQAYARRSRDAWRTADVATAHGIVVDYDDVNALGGSGHHESGQPVLVRFHGDTPCRGRCLVSASACHVDVIAVCVQQEITDAGPRAFATRPRPEQLNRVTARV